jgi:hypothetical protein
MEVNNSGGCEIAAVNGFHDHADACHHLRSRGGGQHRGVGHDECSQALFQVVFPLVLVRPTPAQALRELALPRWVRCWDLTTLREKLVKIG